MTAIPIVPGLLYYCRMGRFASIIPATNGVHALEIFLDTVSILFTTIKE